MAKFETVPIGNSSTGCRRNLCDSLIGQALSVFGVRSTRICG